jgi:hypothetical protein
MIREAGQNGEIWTVVNIGTNFPGVLKHRRREPGGALRVRSYARAASSAASDSAPASSRKVDRCREEDIGVLYGMPDEFVKAVRASAAQFARHYLIHMLDWIAT